MWNRTFSQECFGSFYNKYHACNQLRQVLDRTSCKRLVIGHTPQVCRLRLQVPVLQTYTVSVFAAKHVVRRVTSVQATCQLACSCAALHLL